MTLRICKVSGCKTSLPVSVGEYCIDHREWSKRFLAEVRYAYAEENALTEEQMDELIEKICYASDSGNKTEALNSLHKYEVYP